MIPCICIDDTNKPSNIPNSLWVRRGNEYHITWIKHHKAQGIQGVELKELKLNEDCLPFNSYALKRFAIRKDDMDMFMELLAVCSGEKINLDKILTDVEIEK